MIRRIVVGSDGSRHAQHAVAFAADLARQLRAEVLLVHATGRVTPAAATASHYLMDVAQYGLCDTGESEHAVERVVRAEWARPLIAARVPWGVDVRYGWAADILARTAEDIGAQLIIIGAGSRHSPGAVTVASALALRTAVPLILVPDEAEAIELHAVEHSIAAT